MNEENKAKEDDLDREVSIIIKDAMIPIKSPEVTIREEIYNAHLNYPILLI